MGKVAFLKPPDSTSKEMADEELLRLYAAGDIAALGELFDRHHTSLHRFISRLAGADRDDVDDLLQNTFLQIAGSAGSFAGRSSAKSWLFGVAVNVVRRHVRKGALRRKILKAVSEVPSLGPRTPLGEAQARQQVAILAEAVEELPYKLKEPFVMCELEGISGVEAARILGLKDGTLWRRLHDARKRLSEELERGRS